jgi:hypothetical protein
MFLDFEAVSYGEFALDLDTGFGCDIIKHHNSCKQCSSYCLYAIVVFLKFIEHSLIRFF